MLLPMNAHQLEADVVVVGAGNAALVAALTAHEAGARVVVLEAAPRELRGGNSRFAGAIFRVPHDGMTDITPLLCDEAQGWAQRAETDPYPADTFLRDMVDTSDGRSDPELVGTVVERAYQTVEWMRDQGVRWELTVGKLLDPDTVEGTYSLPPGGVLRAEGEGVGLVANLYAAVERAGIEILYETPAHELLTEGDHVLGVRARRVDSWLDVRGRVVLACGGFEANPELRQQYLGAGWDLVKVRGSRFNTGTMLQKALASGAQPYGHWGGCHASPLDADAPPMGDLALTDKLSRYSYPYAIMVNADAERFVDEGEDHVWLTYAKTGSAIRRQPRGLAFQIFDQRTVGLLEPRYSTGTPVQAPTIAELAQALRLDPVVLERTVSDFNAATGPGSFDAFDKDGLATAPGLLPPKSNWAQPITEPPFVAYRVTCGITFTYGGLKTDARARVLNREDRPMPGLYATGEIAGGFFFHNYPGGSGLTRGAVFGRIAGQEAALAAGAPA